MNDQFGWLAMGLIGAILTLFPTHCTAAEVVDPIDCSPDDASPCIQSAIDRASERGDEVVLLPGTYTLLRPVRLATGVSVFGSSTTVIRPSAQNAESVLLVFGADVHDITIGGMTFDGGGHDFPSESAMIVINGTQNVVLDRVTLQHSRGSALAVYSDMGVESRGNGIQNSLITDIGNHWRTTENPSGRIMGTDFWDDTPRMSFGNFARYNVFRDIGLDAIHLAGQQGFVAEGNIFELKNEEPEVLEVGDFPAAFFAETSSDLTVRNNTMREAMGNCIDVPGVTDALIEGNLIVGCGQSGIGVFQDYDFDKADSSNVTIRNNIILNSANWAQSPWQAGITIAQGKPTNIVIEDNIITDLRPKAHKTQDYGIEVVNDAQNGIVTRVKGLTIGAGNRLDGNQRAKTHGIK